MPELKDAATERFHSRRGVHKEAYLDCMIAYLDYKTEPGWYSCPEGSRIAGGMGVIKSDFHDRNDLIFA